MGMQRTSGDYGGATLTVLPGLHTVAETNSLRTRAQFLRELADRSPGPLGAAYRRRAAEIDFQAWLTELRSGRMVAPVAA